MDKIFEIELPQLPAATNFGEAAKAQQGLVLAALGAMAKATWTRLAQDRLSSRRRDLAEYVRSIQDPEILPDMASVALVGKRAHDIEFGRASYDLRDVLLGPKVPVKQRGGSGKGKYRSKAGQYYRYIPFRHGGPDSLGTTGAPMGSPYASAMGAEGAAALGQRVYKLAKELSASAEKPGRQVQWGERFLKGIEPKLKPHHSGSIYDSMVRIEKAYLNPRTGKQTVQSSYKTFRTISTAKKIGWIVPATTGYHLLIALKAHMKVQAPAYITQVINTSSSGGAPPTMPTGNA